MERKKMVKSVTIYADVQGNSSGAALHEYVVGRDQVVNIQIASSRCVQIYFRAEDDQQKTKMEDRPYRFYSGFRFIVEER